jgi:flagellar motor switch protein FliG
MSRTRKAALLLQSLDPPTAAQLLAAASAETVTQIAAELAYLSKAGAGAAPSAADSLREFSTMLHGDRPDRSGEDFVKQVLDNVVSRQDLPQVLAEVDRRLETIDPFLPVRPAPAAQIAAALSGESPQAAAVVLGELPPKKSAEILALLDEQTRGQAVGCMTSGQAVSAEAKFRVAAVVRSRLQAGAAGGEQPGAAPPAREAQWRKVALLLRTLPVELRDAVLASLGEQDADAAQGVRDRMVTWEDLPQVADRGLQEALRQADARDLALALTDADEAVAQTIRRNISERAQATLDEEASLLSAPKPAEIAEARQKVLAPLREMNARGEVQFEEAAV